MKKSTVILIFFVLHVLPNQWRSSKKVVENAHERGKLCHILLTYMSVAGNAGVMCMYCRYPLYCTHCFIQNSVANTVKPDLVFMFLWVSSAGAMDLKRMTEISKLSKL